MFRVCGKVGEEEVGWVLFLLNIGIWICGYRCLCVLGVGGRLGVRLRVWMICRMGVLLCRLKCILEDRRMGF